MGPARVEQGLALEAKACQKEGHKAWHRMVDPTFRRVKCEDGTPARMAFVVDDMGIIQDVIKLVLVYLGLLLDGFVWQ
ncbi:hypothetical protein FRC11_013528, partial [Ceratobasidium sp. 423]